MKVLIIGAGNVGAHVGYLCMFIPEIEEVLLYDVNQELLQGKCLDLNHSAGVIKRDIKFTPIQNLRTKADIVVITAGFPRKQGMSRFDLLDANVSVVDNIISELEFDCLKDAIFIIVSNPVDVLTYYFYKKTSIPREKLMGMAGVLDTGRFRYYLAHLLNKKISEVEAVVIGSHSKDMVCIYKDGNRQKIQQAIEETQNAGAKIVSYYKGGSAYFAPALGVKIMIDAIIRDKKEILPAVAILNREYGYSDISFGVPVKLGKDGIEEIIELALSPAEKEALESSIQGIKASLNYLKTNHKL
ncbi:MAG TPA: malate dehydrogenase [Candidatus Omnitrophica bacterium]|nr:malate dehydrogenase [Candidatus Omnitrophota bacterium]